MAGRSPGSPVCPRSLPCVLLLLMCSCPVLFLGPCFGGLYGFSGCHTPFVPVERIGRISFMGLKPTKRFGSGKLKNLCYYFCLEDNSDCFLTYCNWQWWSLYLPRWHGCCATFIKAWGTLLLQCWGLQIHSLTQALIWADRNQTPMYRLENTLYEVLRCCLTWLFLWHTSLGNVDLQGQASAQAYVLRYHL